MKCPYCKSDRHTVSFSGNREDDRTRLGYYRRKRKCLDCGRKFWTVEEYVPSEQIRRGQEMSVQYIHAKDGYEFRITSVGMMVRSIRNKYVDMPQSQYKHCAPKTWLTSGYIEEVGIEQNETVQNVSIWK